MMLFIIFSLLTGYVVDVEVHTPNGRVDIVLLTDIRLYIIELKLNRDAQTALQQINLKNYAQRFALCGKPIVKVGVNFDSAQGNIEDWIIEENDWLVSLFYKRLITMGMSSELCHTQTLYFVQSILG